MVVRELITLIGFRVNAGELAYAERAYGRLRQQSQGIAQGISSIGRNATVFLTLPLAMMGKHIVTAANNMQLLQVSMETYTGSAEAARLKTKELMDLAVRSPLASVEDIGKTARQLLGRGLDSASLIPVLERLINLSGAFQAPIQNVAKAYTDVKALGNLRAQEKNQFANAGIDIMKIVGEYIGKTRGQVMEMMSKRLITFDMMDQALEKFAGKGSKVAELIERIAATPYGQWMKFKDQVMLLEAKVGAKVLPMLAKIVAGMAEFVSKLNALNPNLHRFMLILGGFVALVGPLLLIKSLLVALAGPFGIVLAVVAALAVVIDDIYVWVKGGKSIFGVLFGDFKDYEKPLAALKDQVVGLWYDHIKPMLQEARAEVRRLLEGFGGGGKGISAMKTVLDIAKGIASALGAIVDALRLLGQIPKAVSYDPAKIKDAVKTREEIAKGRSKDLTGGFGASDAGNRARERMLDILGPVWDFATKTTVGDAQRWFKGPQPAMAGAPMEFNLTVQANGTDANTIAASIKPIISQFFKDEVLPATRRDYVTLEK